MRTETTASTTPGLTTDTILRVISAAPCTNPTIAIPGRGPIVSVGVVGPIVSVGVVAIANPTGWQCGLPLPHCYYVCIAMWEWHARRNYMYVRSTGSNLAVYVLWFPLPLFSLILFLSVPTSTFSLFLWCIYPNKQSYNVGKTDKTRPAAHIIFILTLLCVLGLDYFFKLDCALVHNTIFVKV